MSEIYNQGYYDTMEKLGVDLQKVAGIPGMPFIQKVLGKVMGHVGKWFGKGPAAQAAAKATAKGGIGPGGRVGGGGGHIRPPTPSPATKINPQTGMPMNVPANAAGAGAGAGAGAEAAGGGILQNPTVRKWALPVAGGAVAGGIGLNYLNQPAPQPNMIEGYPQQQQQGYYGHQYRGGY